MFLFSYPLAALLKRIPDSKPYQKNAFVVATSLFYLVGVFTLWDGLRTFLYSSVLTYAIMYYVDGSIMPWLVFVLLMGHMSISHIERQRIGDPSQIDITGGQMVLIMKLHALSWNIHDGRLKPELLTDSQKERAIYQMPSLLDYAGYVLFFPSIFTGPAFDVSALKYRPVATGSSTSGPSSHQSDQISNTSFGRSIVRGLQKVARDEHV